MSLTGKNPSLNETSRSSTVYRLKYMRNLLVVALGGLLVGFYVIIPTVQAYQTTHPRRWSACCASPADFDLEYEEVSLETSDGLTLSGWYIPSQNGAAIIIVHGYGGNRTGSLAHAAMLDKHGYGALLFDLRAHGDSEGDVFAFGWESDKDVLAALDYLQNRPDVNGDQIGALGLSAGAQVLMQTATQTDRIKAVVSDGAGSHTFKDSLFARNWALAPGTWVFYKSGELLTGVPSALPLVDTLSQIAPRELMLIAATQGSMGEIPANQAYYRAAGEPKTLWELPGVSHTSGLFAKPEIYEGRVIAFFDQALLP